MKIMAALFVDLVYVTRCSDGDHGQRSIDHADVRGPLCFALVLLITALHRDLPTHDRAHTGATDVIVGYAGLEHGLVETHLGVTFGGATSHHQSDGVSAHATCHPVDVGAISISHVVMVMDAAMFQPGRGPAGHLCAGLVHEHQLGPDDVAGVDDLLFEGGDRRIIVSTRCDQQTVRLTDRASGPGVVLVVCDEDQIAVFGFQFIQFGYDEGLYRGIGVASRCVDATELLIESLGIQHQRVTVGR